MQGWIRQGVDWFRWGDTTLNTYVTLRYKWDTERFDWNNTLGPGIGAAFEVYNAKGIVAQWGVEYIWEQYYIDDRTEQKLLLYMGWYAWWDLAPR